MHYNIILVRYNKTNISMAVLCQTRHHVSCMLAQFSLRNMHKGGINTITLFDTYIYAIAPILEIKEIRFRDIDPDVHADSRYRNGIERLKTKDEFCSNTRFAFKLLVKCVVRYELPLL